MRAAPSNGREPLANRVKTRHTKFSRPLDGGFIVAGYTHPDDAIAEYDDDMYVLKLNKTGELNQ